jgi:hypothetical protein
LAGAFTDAFFTGAFFATFRVGAFAAFTGAFFTGAFATLRAGAAAFTGVAFFAATFFTAVFFATAGTTFTAAARFAAHLFFVASEMALRPAALNLRLGLEGSGVAFDDVLESFAGGFFAVPEDACKLTAFFAREMAVVASRSSPWMWGALAEDRSVTSDISASILAIRLRTFLAFMTTPVHVHSAMDFPCTLDGIKIALPRTECCRDSLTAWATGNAPPTQKLTDLSISSIVEMLGNE